MLPGESFAGLLVWLRTKGGVGIGFLASSMAGERDWVPDRCPGCASSGWVPISLRFPATSYISSGDNMGNVSLLGAPRKQLRHQWDVPEGPIPISCLTPMKLFLTAGGVAQWLTSLA